MKRMLMIVCGIMGGVSAYATPKPKADVHFRVTDDLPKLAWQPPRGYSGVFTVTNTGETAFTVISDSEWADATRFYRGANGNLQHQFDETMAGKKQRDEERMSAKMLYDGVVEKYPDSTKVLQPGESTSFEYKNITFNPSVESAGNILKAEMYLGHDTWIPVHITPSVYPLRVISWNTDKTPGDFFYSQEETNQYLYVKTDEGKFRRVSEMKVGSLPEKEKNENAVMFELPDGTKKKLALTEARRIANERTQQTPKE